VFLRRAFLHQSHRRSFINAFTILVRGNAHAIAGLKIADLRGLAGSANVFSRPGRKGGDRLIVELNDDIFVFNLPQHPGLRGRGGLIGRRPLLARRILAARIPTRVSTRITATWVSAAGISDARNDDLAEAGNAGQQQNGQ
jgi:hypothetical protein